MTPEPAPLPAAPAWARRAFIALVLLTFGLRLAYASVELNYGRFFDEKFVMANVYSAIDSGTLRPANGYYPSLSYLPQVVLVAASHGLYRATGVEVFKVKGPEAPLMTATAFFLCRLLQVVFGVGVLCLTYHLGRRVASAEVGLLAAFLLAVMPNQIRMSAFFKPDILVTMFAPLLVLATLRVVARPSRGGYLVAGMLVGLATAAKYTGASLALPLVVAAVVTGWRHRERWSWLVMAGVTSVATFVLVNPHLDVTLGFMPNLGSIYETKGARAGGTHLTIFRDAFDIVVAPAQHGPLLGAVALGGGLVLLLLAFGRPLPRWLAGVKMGAVELAAGRPLTTEQRLVYGLLLAIPLGYTALYAAAATITKANNFLHVIPFTALWAAWLLVGVGRALTARWSTFARRATLQLTALTLVVFLGGPAVTFCLTPLIPTATGEAEEILFGELQPLYLREVVHEPLPRQLQLQDRRGLASTRVVAALASVSPARLALADAEMFPAARLDEANSDAYSKRLATGEVRRLGGHWLASEPPQVLVLHPWQLAGEPLALTVTEVAAARRRRSEPGNPNRRRNAAARAGEAPADGPAAEDTWSLDDETEPSDQPEDDLPSELTGTDPVAIAPPPPPAAGGAATNPTATTGNVAELEPDGELIVLDELSTPPTAAVGEGAAKTSRRRGGQPRPPQLRHVGEDTSRWQIALPAELATGTIVSVAVRLPRRMVAGRDLELRPLGGAPLQTLRTRATRRMGFHQTARFALPAPDRRIFALTVTDYAGDTRPQAELFVWQPASGVR